MDGASTHTLALGWHGFASAEMGFRVYGFGDKVCHAFRPLAVARSEVQITRLERFGHVILEVGVCKAYHYQRSLHCSIHNVAQHHA